MSIEGWTYLEGVVSARGGDSMNRPPRRSQYFAQVTLLTIGFGDFAPTTQLGRGIWFIFVLLGLGLLAFAISSISARFEQRAAQRLARRRALGRKKADGGGGDNNGDENDDDSDGGSSDDGEGALSIEEGDETLRGDSEAALFALLVKTRLAIARREITSDSKELMLLHVRMHVYFETL
jgi:hypothetical protein